jgi:hypothetical protein
MNIFVFGSNREGRHGKGAALEAMQKYWATYGQPHGPQGLSYAIVTKELRNNWPPVSLDEIGRGVYAFLLHARRQTGDTFLVTRIGCGLAGFTDAQIAPLFKGAPDNVKLPEGWRELA